MGKTKKVGRTGRFGARYGLRIRKLVRKVEDRQKIKHLCPYCKNTGKVKRLSAGIWECRKCDSKFTGKAYEVK
jgi:large subunit ribosomal protein L37Ae